MIAVKRKGDRKGTKGRTLAVALCVVTDKASTLVHYAF